MVTMKKSYCRAFLTITLMSAGYMHGAYVGATADVTGAPMMPGTITTGMGAQGTAATGAYGAQSGHSMHHKGNGNTNGYHKNKKHAQGDGSHKEHHHGHKNNNQ